MSDTIDACIYEALDLAIDAFQEDDLPSDNVIHRDSPRTLQLEGYTSDGWLVQDIITGEKMTVSRGSIADTQDVRIFVQFLVGKRISRVGESTKISEDRLERFRAAGGVFGSYIS